MLVSQNSWDRLGGMLVGHTVGVGMQVCWSVKQLG